MGILNKYFKDLRKKNNLTLTELSNKIDISISTISKIENGANISYSIKSKYANYFNQSLNHYANIERNNNYTSEDLDYIKSKNLGIITLPYFESISAGIEQELNDNNPVDYIQIPNYENFFKNEKDLFAVKVNGESMNKIIPNGSTVVLDTNINKCNFKNGDIIAYQLDNEFGLKRIYETPDKILLVPESWDETYKTKELKIDNINQLYSFSVVGKLIYQFNKSF